MVYIKTPTHNILVDAGLHQTNSKFEDYQVNNRNYKEFKVKDIDLIFITHCHGDHCLLSPKLYKNGCTATTIISKNSKGVLARMAEDCAYINERDIIAINSQHKKNHSPLYTITDVQNFLDHVVEKPIGEKVKVDDTLSFQFIPSGHLLGGCQVLLYITNDNQTKTVLITGDIGNKNIHNYFVGDFYPVDKATLVIGESTYGNRPDIHTGVKERKNDLDKLTTILNTQICEMHGSVLIPTFAQSRAQQLALMIYKLHKENQWNFNVYIDSPLSIKIFKEYSMVLEGEEKDLFEELLNWNKLIFVKESEDSKALISNNEPCCIISTSGMCQVGRVRHHLKKLIPNPNATILFVGYSTDGSLASKLKDNKVKTVTIDQKEYVCRCSSYNLKSMSGHAPFSQLLDYYSSIQTPKIILHHGSQVAKETLKSALEKEFAKKCKSTKVVIANQSMKVTL